jgi:hypothetical protein
MFQIWVSCVVVGVREYRGAHGQARDLTRNKMACDFQTNEKKEKRKKKEKQQSFCIVSICNGCRRTL